MIYCGEVDINAFKLLGASSKEDDDTKIGFWGSGLKYALAVLLRNDVEILASSGLKEIKIGKRGTTMRGEKYEVITINNQPTSITTRAGKDWKLWFAIREIYANGLDEDGFEMTTTDGLQPEKGFTKIYVEMTDGIKDIFNNFERYFSKKRQPLERLGRDKIYQCLDDHTLIIYRRGMRVHKEDVTFQPLYDYDIYNVKINESRVVTSGFELEWEMVELWRARPTLEMVNRFLTNKCWERGLEFTYRSGTPFNNNWLLALENTVVVPEEKAGFFIDELRNANVQLPLSLCKELYKQFGNKLKIAGMTGKGQTYNKVETTDEHREMLSKAIKTLEKLEIDVNKYQIDVVRMHDDSCLGLADMESNKILLSEDAFGGTKLLASTLYEEFVHLEYGYEDYTRRMQTFLFKQIIDLIS